MKKTSAFTALALAGLLSSLALHAEPEMVEPRPTGQTATPLTLPGAETFIYHDVKPEPMRLHVFKPRDWSANDQRPALVHFFGGGWQRGLPTQSASVAARAAKLGLVGVAVDYRVRDRHSTDGTASISDARAAVRWLQDHAAELGLDPKRIVVSGSSAGGHLALWTAISNSPPGSDPAVAPREKPVALILLWPAADFSFFKSAKDRFGGHGIACSATQNLDPVMPPSLLLHGDQDSVVPFESSVVLHRTLTQSGNACEFIPMPGCGHGTTLPEWKKKQPELVEKFLREQGLIPVSAVTASPPKARGDLDPRAAPGRNFDLSHWKLTLPINRAEEHSAAELVAGYQHPEAFFTDPATGGMTFRAPNHGDTTSGSRFARSELREMLAPSGSPKAAANNWIISTSPDSTKRDAGGVDGTLRATLTVDRVSITGDAAKVGRVIVGQIHGPSTELIRLYYHRRPSDARGAIYFAHEDPQSGDSVFVPVLGDPKHLNPPDGIVLGETWSYEIQVVGRALTVRVTPHGRATTTVTHPIHAGYDGLPVYFKAGVYNQNNTGAPDDYVQATFHSLTHRHP